ncbi:VOC family protein [Adhaeribacter pallidiroseus]|uniref:VOC domain-containing protein n=1 Tax=Adhaeribacter pallidiroseus TaxID=2072847 RepID=A0A369QL66_9BACT|nr:VOC family protein [Adhaeribacter pallidiroseus]RDC65464.1 hypothetical protein AHMF7616_04094 [Adhaeribacter pallidiroseus]
MKKIKTSIQPWLSVRNSAKALKFYQEAFGALETYRLDSPDGGLVLGLSIDGAAFWVSGHSADTTEDLPTNSVGDSIKFILTVDNPDLVFSQALRAGAEEIFPVGEDFGWRLGKVADPFGFHWEIGKQL